MSIPWRAKIALKMVMSRLPVSHAVWRRLGLFKHGDMEQPAYALEVFRRHYDRVEFPRKGDGFVCLELGPGDSLLSALIARCAGAAMCYLIDTGRFAVEDAGVFRRMADHLRQLGGEPPALAETAHVADILKACHARYETQGVASLRTIPDHSVDYIWSNAVLEHVREREFRPLVGELRRIVRADGVCSHRVDLRDHLANALNHLRFAKGLWEAEFFAKSGFYTNRIGYRKMLEIFESLGFHAEVIQVDRWEVLPTPRSRLATEFRVLPDEELRISGFDVTLRPRVA